jgi:hypothetical protein
MVCSAVGSEACHAKRAGFQRDSQPRFGEGGPRPARVRIWLRRAAARPALGVCGRARRAGMPTDEAISAWGVDVVAAVEPGNAGQVEGAARNALPGAASAMTAAMPIDIAQWWAP